MIKFNSQKGLATVVIVLFVLVLIGIVGGGVYYYKIQYQKLRVPGTDWRKYENQFNFSFYYPNALMARDNDQLSATPDGPIVLSKIFYGTNLLSPEISFFVISLKNFDVNKISEKEKPYFDKESMIKAANGIYEEVRINKLKGIRRLDNDKTYEIVSLFTENYVYHVSISAQLEVRTEELFETAVFTGKPYSINREYKDVSQIRIEKSRDSAKIIGLHQLQLGLEIYYEQYKTYPPSLEILIKDHKVNEFTKLTMPISDYLYAIDSKKTGKYHLGTRLSNPNDEFLFGQSDADFNSLKEEWHNGFSGADLIYDRLP